MKRCRKAVNFALWQSQANPMAVAASKLKLKIRDRESLRNSASISSIPSYHQEDGTGTGTLHYCQNHGRPPGMDSSGENFFQRRLLSSVLAEAAGRQKAEGWGQQAGGLGRQ